MKVSANYFFCGNKYFNENSFSSLCTKSGFEKRIFSSLQILLWYDKISDILNVCLEVGEFQKDFKRNIFMEKGTFYRKIMQKMCTKS